MLVVTANWAIPDGSVAAPPCAAMFDRLLDDIRCAAVRAGVRRDGRYRPIERLVIVLAGDTFDGLVSRRWVDDVRPWDRGRRVVTRHEDVLRGALHHARRPLAMLVRLVRRGIVVPAADHRGRPAWGSSIVIPVRAVLLAGDRDAVVERVSGRAWCEDRGVGIGSVWDGEGVGITHGSACDPLAAGQDAPTLIESLAVDLLARFGAAFGGRAVLAEHGRRIVRALVDGPSLDMPLRLRSALPTIVAGAADTDWVVSAWRRAVDRWEREARRVGCEDGHGAVAAITAWMHALGDDAVMPPATKAVLATLSSTLPAGAVGPWAAPLTVLGHPATVGCGAGGGVVCPGPDSVRRWKPFQHRGSATGAVACIETAPVVHPRRLPAVAILEPDEGSERGLAWWTMWDPVIPRAGCEAPPILEAA